jgi:4-hydroxy-3-methylbut-2-enyl diphosphate reductase
MKITVAKNGGFCFGVKNAVDLAKRAAAESSGGRVYTLGKLIHNETVTARLAALGITEAESPAGIESGATVVIRSHGVSKAVLDALAERGAAIVDATCPFVQKIQSIVYEYDQKGCKIVILGDPPHPEVIGINGWCGGRAAIVRSESDVDKIPAIFWDNPCCVVAQTTFSAALYGLITKKIQKLLPKSVEFFDTIC